jgi:AcrR family transcriptional regulator
MSSADVSVALVEAAARIISEEGRPGLSNRRVTAEVGTSTMAIYTHFGSIDGLVAAVVDEGFARLAEHLRAVPRDDDPLTVLLHLADAYRENAVENRHLYAVMFSAAATSGGPAEVTRHRHDTFDVLVAATQFAMDAGLLNPDDAECVAGQLWSALHGYVMLELAGFMRAENDTATTVLQPLLINLGTALSMARP